MAYNLYRVNYYIEKSRTKIKHVLISYMFQLNLKKPSYRKYAVKIRSEFNFGLIFIYRGYNFRRMRSCVIEHYLQQNEYLISNMIIRITS